MTHPRQQVAEEALAFGRTGWDAWVAGLGPHSLTRSISDHTFDTAFSFAGFVPGVIERIYNDTETTYRFEDYLPIAASPDRIGLGQKNLTGFGGSMGDMVTQPMSFRPTGNRETTMAQDEVTSP